MDSARWIFVMMGAPLNDLFFDVDFPAPYLDEKLSD